MLSGLVWVRKCMWVVVYPNEKRLAGLLLTLHEVHGSVGDVVVDRHHPRLGQWAGVLAHLFADPAEKRGSTVGSSVSEALQSITPRGPYLARNAGDFG